MKHLGMLMLMCGLTFLVTGCGDDGVDEDKSVDDVKKDIEKMDAKDLRAQAEKYKEVIETKLAEVAKLKDKLPSATDLTELASEDTKNLKADIEKLNEAIKPLKEKLEACVAKLKKEGEDVSDLEIK